MLICGGYGASGRKAKFMQNEQADIVKEQNCLVPKH
jgi:hypothetical protein